MFEQRLQIEEGQHLALVEMQGNVRIDGWEENEVLIRLQEGERDDLTIEAADPGLEVSARRSCEIWVPHDVPVTVREVKGGLRISGVENLNAEQVRGNLKLSKAHEVVLAEVYGNLRATGTGALRLVGTVYGNASLKSVESADFQNIRGNVQGKGVGSLRFSRIGGNLRVKEASGPLDVDRTGGNVDTRSVAGAVTVNQVAGNLTAQDLTGGAKFERVGGNLAFGGAVGEGHSYYFKAGGNAAVWLPEETNAHVTMVSKGHLVSGLKLSEAERERHRLSGTLGTGGAEIFIEAGGNAVLGSRQRGDVGDEVARQVQEALAAVDLEAISRQVEESLRDIDLDAIGQRVGQETEQALSRLRIKLESVDWEQMGVRAREATERAMARLERDVERLEERAARQQRYAERQAEHKRRHEEWRRRRAEARQAGPAGEEMAAQASEEAEAAAAPVDPEPSLDEERLSILKMVEQGQISPEEAEMLLDALS
jgi:hypothetical protein